MTREELRQFLEHPELLTAEQLPDLMALSRLYPYSAPLHILILLCLHRAGDLRFAGELHQRALYIQDLAHLFCLLDSNGKAVSHKASSTLADEGKEESSFNLIDNFLQEHPDDSSELDYILSLESDAPPSTLIEDECNEVEMSSNELIDNFLNKGEEVEIIAPAEKDMPLSTPNTTPIPEDELLTETLARIYIRQGKYERALKILRQINLEYPKKSGYFAQQISFLEKLARNNQN